MTQKEGLAWLENEFKTSGEHFNQTELYKLLKKYLKASGYWKGKPRGKPTINNLTPRMKQKSNISGNTHTNEIYYEPFDI